MASGFRLPKSVAFNFWNNHFPTMQSIAGGGGGEAENVWAVVDGLVDACDVPPRGST